MELKESIKIMRKELGMTQAELALELGISLSSITRWEIGKSVPKAKTITAILSLAISKGVSDYCLQQLRQSLQRGHKEVLRLSNSNLFPVERDTLCQLVDDSNTAIYVADMENYELLYANHKTEEYIGKRFETNKGITCYQFLHDRNTPCLSCNKHKLENQKFSETHFTFPKSGRTFRIQGRTLYWNGRAAHAEYCYDETGLLEAQNGLHEFLNSLDTGICAYWVNDDGSINMNYMNDGYFSIVGSTRQQRHQYAGFGVMNAVCQQDRQRVKNLALINSKAKKSFQMRYRVVLEDGSLKELYMRANFIRRENDKSLYHCTVIDVDGCFDSTLRRNTDEIQ